MSLKELKKGIRLRSYGQHDPVVEYRLEGFDMFDDMIKCIREDTIKMLLVIPKRVAERLKQQDEMRQLAVKRAASGRARAAAIAALNAQKAGEDAQATINVRLVTNDEDESPVKLVEVTKEDSEPEEDEAEETVEEAEETAEETSEKKYSDDDVQKAAEKFMKREQVAVPTSINLEGESSPVNRTVKKVKIGRNDPCPCGSGKKYKKCCGRNE